MLNFDIGANVNKALVVKLVLFSLNLPQRNTPELGVSVCVSCLPVQ